MLAKDGIKFDNAIFDVGVGWEPLLRDLYAYIAKLKSTVRVVQVKEKFGGLRFYIDVVTMYLGKTDEENIEVPYFEEEVKPLEIFIDKICGKSYKICELCGEPGMIRKGRPWIKTLCDKCNG